jgi:hypothetical protein
MVYVGPTPDVGDLHCERLRIGLIGSVWELSPAERERIANGANIKLFIYNEPIPPVMLGVVEEPGVGEDAPELRERLREFAEQQA